MSIASVTDADYTTVVSYFRDHLAAGTSLSGDEMRLALAVVKDATTRAGQDAAIDAAVTALTALDATACAANAGATAAAVIVTQCAALTAASTALGDPTYTTNTVLDGNAS